MKKIEDSSCSLPSHFWSTSRSPFSTCYIPFQSSGSQESNAINCVQFEAKMRKIWPSEDNCIKQVRISHHQPKQVRISHQPMQVRISHHVLFMQLWCEISSILPTPHEIFSFVFFYVNSFLILVISHSQALLCKKTIRGVEIISRKIYCIFYT